MPRQEIWKKVQTQLQELAKSFYMTAGETLLRSESSPEVVQKVTAVYDQCTTVSATIFDIKTHP